MNLGYTGCISNEVFFHLNLDCAEIADEVYMEVIVGEEEAASLPDTQLEDSGVNKTFVPVAWAAAYGRMLDSLFMRVPPLWASVELRAETSPPPPQPLVYIREELNLLYKETWFQSHGSLECTQAFSS